MLYEIVFRGDNLPFDPQIGTLIREDTIVLEEGNEPLVTARVYQREMFVKEANLFYGVKREQALEKFKAKQGARTTPQTEDELTDMILEFSYIPLAACTVGQIPTFYEYAHILSDQIAEAWVSTARETNPHWWGDLEKKN